MDQENGENGRNGQNGAIVEARELRKVYRGGSEVAALKGIDLEIARGELLAIIGPSGSGKTTLLNCLSGLERIDGGEVLVDGKDLAKLSDDDRTEYRAKSMGFVFQAFNLLPVLSAVENVEIPMLLLGEGSKQARKRALETLENVGLAPRANHRPDQLSGGEQQRVAVARALVHRPAVVFADEPSSNLDPGSTQAMFDLLGRWKAGTLFPDLRARFAADPRTPTSMRRWLATTAGDRPARTLVLVCHDVQAARRAADRFLLLNGGHTLEADFLRAEWNDRAPTVERALGLDPGTAGRDPA